MDVRPEPVRAPQSQVEQRRDLVKRAVDGDARVATVSADYMAYEPTWDDFANAQRVEPLHAQKL